MLARLSQVCPQVIPGLPNACGREPSVHTLKENGLFHPELIEAEGHRVHAQVIMCLAPWR